MTDWQVLVGDVRESLRGLPNASVQCCVTSPPYWGLRDYGVSGQIGLEPTPDAYVATMVDVFAEVWRVLREDGTLWLNLGDSYAANRAYQVASTKGGSKHSPAQGMLGVSVVPEGLKPKDLVGIPWRVAFALQAAGWYLRSDIIWAKPNPMPESVQDRPTKAHEYIFLLTKRERYYYDAAAIAEPATYAGKVVTLGAKSLSRGQATGMGVSASGNGCADSVVVAEGRNARSVWQIATQPYPEAHFATFPEAIPERCIKAGSKVGDLVLDPFTGSGTTGAVAVKLGRRFVGCELNRQYVELARTRIGGAAPLFAQEVTA